MDADSYADDIEMTAMIVCLGDAEGDVDSYANSVEMTAVLEQPSGCKPMLLSPVEAKAPSRVAWVNWRCSVVVIQQEPRLHLGWLGSTGGLFVVIIGL